jgi:multidrug efflux pump
VQLADIANVQDSVENVRAAGFLNDKPSVPLIVFRQPGANIIETVERIKAAMPSLRASMPAAMNFQIVLDRTTTIRASVHEVERTLIIAVGLVILVVFLFLRNGRATLIPSVAVPVSLIGTFGIMYLCGFSVDNLSLMALTISTGFVVDDAIVVIENISRYLEQGMKPMEAALKGAREVSFTVLSISLSLVAVFIPILLMGGIVGRLFREFAIVLSTAILVSLVVSLTTTPMMCARLLRARGNDETGSSPARPPLSLERKCFRMGAGPLRTQPHLGIAPFGHHAGGVAHHHRREHLSLRYCTEGIFSAAGQRHRFRPNPGRAGRFVHDDADVRRTFREFD